MRLPRLAIENKQFVLIIVLLGVMVGTLSLLTMPRSEDPQPSFPNYTVIALYPGAGPSDMEKLVVDPIEEAIEEVEHIDKIKTDIEEGLVVIRVEGEFGHDNDEIYDDLVTAVNQIKGDLPENLYSLEVNQFDPLDIVMLQYALVSETAEYARMEAVAEKLGGRLEQVEGVRGVEIEAFPEREIRVSLDFPRMARRGVGLAQVVGTLRGDNANVPGGDLESGGRSFNVKSTGNFTSLEGLRRTVVGGVDGQLVYLEDVAEVRMGYEDDRYLARYDGARCLYVSVEQKAGQNLVALSERVQAEAEAFAAESLPDGMRLETAFEQAPAVAGRLNGFFSNLLQGVALVGAVVLLFLGFRSAAVVMTVIPVAVVMGVGMLDMSGYGLQQISIAALVIALGLLVDNGIVVVENVVRFRKMGHSPLEAAAKGAGEVGYAIASSTVTTLLAFFPLVMLENGPGEFLRTLPLTVIFTLVASLALPLTLTPVMASAFFGKPPKETPSFVERRVRWAIERLYRPALGFALRRWGWVTLAAALATVGSFALFPSIGVSFFPTADKPMLLVDVETPEGSSLARTDRAVRYVESVLSQNEYVRAYAASVGHGNPYVYYNRIPEEYGKSVGQVLVHFEEWEPKRFYANLFALQKAFDRYGDARITFRELKNGPPFDAAIEIKALGPDLDTLKALAYQIEGIVRRTPGTRYVDNPWAVSKTDLRVAVNRDKAAMYGLPLNEIDLAVRASMAGVEADKTTFDNGEEFPIVVRTPFDDHPEASDFDKVYFGSREGAQVPLRQVAALRFESAASQIGHFNLQRAATVTADVKDPDATAAVTQAIIAELDKLDFPQGYSYYVGGEYETQQSSFGDLGQLLLVALVSIFAVLVLQFRSLAQPLIVFSAIPLALSGSMVALYLTGWSFSFFAFVGFTSLVGIVVNNSIILVDYANQLMAEGMGKLEALKASCETRFTPILLTTATTILGLLPLTASATGLWSPLGWTIIGGMVSSTFLTLFVVPILYKLLTKAKPIEIDS